MRGTYLGGTYQLLKGLGLAEETHKSIFVHCWGPFLKDAKVTFALLVNNVMKSASCTSN